MKAFVDLLFNDLKKEIKSLQTENFDLRKSLEFTQGELLDLNKKILDNSKKNSSTCNAHTDIGVLSEQVRALEDDRRINNLCVTGLQESAKENVEQLQNKIVGLISNKLEQKEVKVLESFRVGKPSQSAKPSPRPVIVKLSSSIDKVKCLKSSSKLKGSDIFISDDVCKATQEIRRGKLAELKQKRKDGFIAYFSGADIVFRRRLPGFSDVTAATQIPAAAPAKGMTRHTSVPPERTTRASKKNNVIK